MVVEISTGVGGLRKNPFCGGEMDIFWNYSLVWMWPIIFHNILVHANISASSLATEQDCH